MITLATRDGEKIQLESILIYMIMGLIILATTIGAGMIIAFFPIQDRIGDAVVGPSEVITATDGLILGTDGIIGDITGSDMAGVHHTDLDMLTDITTIDFIMATEVMDMPIIQVGEAIITETQE